MPAVDLSPHVYDLTEDEKRGWSALRRVLGTTPCQGWAPVAELLPGFFLSGGEVAEDLDRLKALGITSILNCAPQEVATGAAFYASLGSEVCYQELPAFHDTEETDLRPFWDQAKAFIQQQRTHDAKVLVHCLWGVNRSASIAVAYVMLESHCGLLEAVRRVKSQRTCVLTNETFQQGLVKLAVGLGLPLDDEGPQGTPRSHLDSLAEEDSDDSSASSGDRDREIGELQEEAQDEDKDTCKATARDAHLEAALGAIPHSSSYTPL